jgi:trimethylamine--corrinoid protein Co-methyltransferase
MSSQLDLVETTEAAPTRRGRRRRGGGDKAGPELFPQKPFKQPRHIYKPVEAVSADELESIHEASMRVLEDIGIDFLHEEAKEILKAAGADVTPGSDRVRMDRAMVEVLVGKTPDQFTVHARNPAHNLTLGGDHIAFSCVASAPNAVDRESGRRPGNQTDYRNFLKLAQFFNIIHCVMGYPVEPVDIHASVRHLDCVSDMIRLMDKVFHIYSLGRERNRDGLELTRIGDGLSGRRIPQNPCVATIINTSSPLRSTRRCCRA